MAFRITDSEWHLTADGTVLTSWVESTHPDRVKYARHPTTRTVGLSDLRALDERYAGFAARKHLQTVVMGCVLVAAVAGGVLGWIVLPAMGATSGASSALLAISMGAFLVCAVAAATMPPAMRRQAEQIYVDAGLESAAGHGVRPDEARALIEAPGTVTEQRPGH